jgi:hypothetical protein
MNKVMALGIFICLLAAPDLRAEEQKSPCLDPKFHQFDFWLGQWDVRRAGSTSAGHADSKISQILGGCVILEEYSTPQGFSGKSFNMYDSASALWRQFWVDNAGNYIEYTGHLTNGAMEFEGQAGGAGGKELSRMRFTKRDADTVLQYIESSTDGGKTWSVYFDGIYTRKK